MISEKVLKEWERDCGGLPTVKSHTRLARAIREIRRLRSLVHDLGDAINGYLDEETEANRHARTKRV